MTQPVAIAFKETDPEVFATQSGRIALVVGGDGKLGQAGR